MNGPTRGYITIRVKIAPSKILIYSGGSVYEISKDRVYVLPRMIKEAHATWNKELGKYVALSRIYYHDKVVVDPVLFNEFLDPSESPITIRYSGNAVKRFVRLTKDVLMKYSRGSNILKLPLSDKLAQKFAICLARMANLEKISDVV